MKLIIAGSRSISGFNSFFKAMDDLVSEYSLDITEGVSGTARGADTLGEVWCQKLGIPVVRMPAEWDKYGSSAGYKRNEDMAYYADAVAIVWDGRSKGSKHMMNIGIQKGIPVYLLNVEEEQLWRSEEYLLKKMITWKRVSSSKSKTEESLF